MAKGVSRQELEKSLAMQVIEEQGLPAGNVRRLLQEQGIDKAMIDRVAQACVPYGHTPDEEE